MYDSNDVANRIREMAKSQKISIKQILCDAGLNYNTMTTYRTSMPKADSLAKIADQLDCSVDYLLGRTNNPLSHKDSNTDSLNILDLESLALDLSSHQSAAE